MPRRAKNAMSRAGVGGIVDPMSKPAQSPLPRKAPAGFRGGRAFLDMGGKPVRRNPRRGSHRNEAVQCLTRFLAFGIAAVYDALRAEIQIACSLNLTFAGGRGSCCLVRRSLRECRSRSTRQPNTGAATVLWNEFDPAASKTLQIAAMVEVLNCSPLSNRAMVSGDTFAFRASSQPLVELASANRVPLAPVGFGRRRIPGPAPAKPRRYVRHPTA